LVTGGVDGIARQRRADLPACERLQTRSGVVGSEPPGDRGGGLDGCSP
jgi:hypothetical protein